MYIDQEIFEPENQSPPLGEGHALAAIRAKARNYRRAGTDVGEILQASQRLAHAQARPRRPRRAPASVLSVGRRQRWAAPAAERAAGAQSERQATACRLLPPVHWALLYTVGSLFVATFILFETGGSFSNEGRHILFTVLCGVMSFVIMVRRPAARPWRSARAPARSGRCASRLMHLLSCNGSCCSLPAPCAPLVGDARPAAQLLRDLSDPSEGMYDATALLGERLSYITTMLNKYEKLPVRAPASSAVLGTSVSPSSLEDALRGANGGGPEDAGDAGEDEPTGPAGVAAALRGIFASPADEGAPAPAPAPPAPAAPLGLAAAPPAALAAGELADKKDADAGAGAEPQRGPPGPLPRRALTRVSSLDGRAPAFHWPRPAPRQAPRPASPRPAKTVR